MIEHGSASVISELEPSVAPAPVATNQRGDINMAELELLGSDEPTRNLPTDDEPTSNEETGDQPTDDQLSGNQSIDDQPSGNQPPDDQPSSNQPTDDQPMGDQPTDEQAMGDQSTDYQPNGDQLADDQCMGDQPTDNKPTDATYTEVSLIAEVQKHPYIFTKDYKGYFEQETKRKEWENVCEGLFPQWNSFSSSKKKDISREVQKKWAKIREPFFKSFGGIRKQLTHVRNVESSLKFLNALAVTYPYGIAPELDEIMIERNEHAYARKYQNASCVDQHVLVNPIPEKVPQEEIAKILEQPAVPSTSTQFSENQSHIPEIATEAMPTVSAQFNENQRHMPEILTAAVLTTSAQNNQGQNDILVPIINQKIQAGFHNIPQTNPAHHQNSPINLTTVKNINFFPMPLPTDDQIFPTTNERGEWIDHDDLELPGADKTIKYASTLCAMLEKLDYDQQCAVWPNLMTILSNASKSKPKKIKILQGELLEPGLSGATRMPATGPEIILQEPFANPELETQEQFEDPELEAQEQFADPELVVEETIMDPEIVEPFAGSGLVAQEQFADPALGIQQTLTKKHVDPESMTESETEETEEECIYPSSYGRPTNAQGEIIYPETDHEDLDED